jgi:hypothetical protein
MIANNNQHDQIVLIGVEQQHILNQGGILETHPIFPGERDP